MDNKEIKNPFIKGQKVVCISDNFPWVKKHGGTPIPQPKPKKGTVLIVDDTLGEYLNFECYNTDSSCNWWFYDRFAPFDDAIKSFEKELDNLVTELQLM